MLNFIAPLVTAAGGIYSAMSGRNAQNSATAYNQAVDVANLQRQDRSAFMQELIAREQQQMAQAATVNARGDKTEYIPGVGWITTPAESTRALINASDGEQTARLTSDSVIRRRGLQENESRRIKEGQVADSFLEQLTQQPNYSVASLRDELLNRATADTNKAFDRTSDRLGTQALRSGASNAGDIMRSLNTQRGEAVRSAGATVNNDARQMFEQLETARTGRNGNLYNMMASRASNFDDVPFAPSNVNDSLQMQQSGSQGRALGAGSMIMSGMSNPGGRIQYTQPNNANANTVGGIASSIGGMFSEFAAQKEYSDLMKMFTDRQLGNSKETINWRN